MKIVSSEFSSSAWDYFLLSKEIAYDNFQQNVDSENLLLALIKKDKFANEILKKNEVNIKEIEKILISDLEMKPKMAIKQDKLFIGETLYQTLKRSSNLKNSLNDVVISTEHILYGLTYDKTCGNSILNTKKIPEFLEIINKMISDTAIENDFDSSN